MLKYVAWIFEEKFGGGSAQEFFETYATEYISKCLSYFKTIFGENFLSDASPFYEKVIAVHSIISEHFETDLFKKVCSTKLADELVKSSKTGLPAIYLTGKYSILKVAQS